ncbi:hypothetical protein IMSAGC001_03452 [Bacteroides acidifaciens]|jgi:hypothetical protein|uniref:Uncharacterized protein n=1 Tax=Bacteroides acidifaciens TaxID=85831 RepID=A0A7J0A6T5_9BACE|nr:hypothetical protein IMSAGC001_03452 [Bacteroides acidifaciens]
MSNPIVTVKPSIGLRPYIRYYWVLKYRDSTLETGV